jgi:hypothetical protein
MSANTSQRKAQGTVLASQVEAFRTWFLIADCGQCGPRARRMADFPVDITVQRLLLRLRRRGCGKPPASVALDNGVEGISRRVLRIWGPGSFGGRHTEAAYCGWPFPPTPVRALDRSRSTPSPGPLFMAGRLRSVGFGPLRRPYFDGTPPRALGSTEVMASARFPSRLLLTQPTLAGQRSCQGRRPAFGSAADANRIQPGTFASRLTSRHFGCLGAA